MKTEVANIRPDPKRVDRPRHIAKGGRAILDKYKTKTDVIRTYFLPRLKTPFITPIANKPPEPNKVVRLTQNIRAGMEKLQKIGREES